MAIQWIERDGSNNIYSLYANEQFPGQESLDESDPEVVAFLAPTPPTPSVRVAEITGGNDLQIVMFKLIFKPHNRVLTQEGSPTITVAQFLTFLEGELT